MMNVRRLVARLSTAVALGLMLSAAPVRLAAQNTRTARHSASTPGAKAAIDINTATMDQLKAVPGIGDVYAKRIIDNRPYTSKDQLVSKGVLPQGVYSKVKNRLIARRLKR